MDVSSNVLFIALALTCTATAHSQIAGAIKVDLTQAEIALSHGDADQASRLFEAAAARGESLEAELGLIRASMFAGEVRKAMAYATMVSGEHPNSSEALALQAYMLDRLGQTERALSILDAARARLPQDATLVAVTAEILTDRLGSERAKALLNEWLRVHPANDLIKRAQSRAVGTGLPSATKSTSHTVSGWSPPASQPFPAINKNFRAGNGVIIDGGARVLTTLRLVGPKTNKVLVRNATGQIRTAVWERQVADGPFVILKLTESYPNNVSLDPDRLGAEKDSRACFVLGYSVASSLDPAYPSISPSIVLRRDVGMTHLLQITAPTSNDHEGSPLFDATGHLIGLVSKDESLIKNSSFAAKLDRNMFIHEKINQDARSPLVATATESAEALYERLAPAVVQIVAAAE
jgi:tetratricopeptide (TPR) repeat protein